jgi:hypothetical protein
MFKNDFIVYLKADGKVLREDKEQTFFIPFGTEYSIGLHNKSSKRAVVEISVDGRSVIGAGRIVVDAGEKTVIERFVQDLDNGRKLKFIEKTSEIEAQRGNKSDDGIITVSVRYEIQKHWWHYTPTYYHYNCRDERTSSPLFGNTATSSGTVKSRLLRSSNFVGNCSPLDNYKKGGPDTGLSNCAEDVFGATLDWCEMPSEDDDCDALVMDSYKEPENEAGITVKGGKSSQKFTTVTVGDVESTVTVFNLALKGFTKAKKKVSKPRTVKAKKICDVCGKKNPFNAEYCMTCSNALDDI